MRSSKRLSLGLANGTKDGPSADDESFQHFAEKHFQGTAQGQFSRKDLRQPLLASTPDSDKQAALSIWKVILRFMGDVADYRAAITPTTQPSVMRRLLVILGQIDKTRGDTAPSTTPSPTGSVMARLYERLGLREPEKEAPRRTNGAPPTPTAVEENREILEEVSSKLARGGGTLRRLKASLTRRLFKEDLEEDVVLDLLPLEESLHTPLEQLHFVIGYGILKPVLRDEIYCQTCKQLVKNPAKSSIARGWLLLALLAGSFPPSTAILKYVIRFLEDGPALYTINVKNNLQRTLQNGPRFQPPAFIELEAGLNKRLLEVSVTLMDGTMHTMPLDAATTSRELCAQLAEFIGLRDQFGFSIYIAMYSKVASLGNGSDHILDSISQCEQLYRETENKEGPAPWRLFYRKEMFSPWENAAHDWVAAGLVFSQVVRGIMLGEYRCESDQQLAVLAAQQYYTEYGSDISEEGLKALLPSYIPADKLQGEESLKLWRRAIIKAHKKMFDVSDALRLPQEKVKQEVVNMAKSRWPMAFSRYFNVTKLEGPSWPNEELVLAVNWTGVYVMTKGGVGISDIPFSEVVEVSDGGGRAALPSDLIMLMLVNGAAIKLSSPDGDDLRNLLTFMFNGLKQRSTFAVVVQACDGARDGELATEEGDLLVLGRQAGLEALVAPWCVGRSERTGEAGKVNTEHIYVLPTLVRPSENTLELFQTHTQRVQGSMDTNTSVV